MTPWAIAGAVIVALLLVLMLVYNRLVKLRNRVDAAWADLDVQLTRRHELIPNLVETVGAYATHERATFDAVLAARAVAERALSEAGRQTRGGRGSQGVEAQSAAEADVAGGVERLLAVAEAYPELKADARFRELQLELVATEDKLAFSRQLYNDTVFDYAETIQSFPVVLVAGPLGFREREPFAARPEQRTGVAINLDSSQD